MRPLLISLAFCVGLLPVAAVQAAQTAAASIPPSGVIGVHAAQLTPAFWIDRAPAPTHILLSRSGLQRQNAQLLKNDPSMHDLRKLPSTLDRARVKGWIEGLSKRPSRTLYDVHGHTVASAKLDALMAKLDLAGIPATEPARYGLVVHRAALRTFPTDLRVFSSRGNTDIDRFQESGIFPGTPVVVVHQTRDHVWSFVVSPRYAAWMKTRYLAVGDKTQVFGYVEHTPYRVVTGAKVRTVYTPEAPAVSELELDMGVRLPVLADWPQDKPVNGQTPYTSWVIELPVRQADGSLSFSPALLQKNTDTTAGYLPMTRANVIGQAFKFLGERYGWGHAYDGRDCSGFVSDVYRSMGAQMPRNTSAQGVSPALAHTRFDADDSHAKRMRAIDKLQIGDLIYIPGHVMMMIGRIDGQPYVIHDVLGMSYRVAGGEMRHVKLNAVSVTPLLPMMFNTRQSFIDRMTSIVRMHH